MTIIEGGGLKLDIQNNTGTLGIRSGPSPGLDVFAVFLLFLIFS